MLRFWRFFTFKFGSGVKQGPAKNSAKKHLNGGFFSPIFEHYQQMDLADPRKKILELGEKTLSLEKFSLV